MQIRKFQDSQIYSQINMFKLQITITCKYANSRTSGNMSIKLSFPNYFIVQTNQGWSILFQDPSYQKKEFEKNQETNCQKYI